ncbi:QacE family quaternary ammonium compound efflux SMR transporter [Polaribacter pacificus]|uniref:Guanidinium exporter n=2 Tax=Polaribacter pacificus TaxID=1775173 RepID=A0A917MDT2_9FLAO|nr:QacE family quaternary ammonium compound efflux SMR transporter [Polaribacter pacificus]
MHFLIKALTFNIKYKRMNWVLLIIAGLFEVAFAACLGKAKEATGTESTYWYIGFLVCLGISMGLLLKVTQHLPIGTAYAVWTGIGAVGTVLVGIFIFKEPATFWRLFFITTLIISIVGLKVVSH